MNFLKTLPCATAIALLFTCLLPGSSAHGQVIFDDSFADADFAKTGSTDTNWWKSGSTSAQEISAGSLGFVTGTSGRGIHTVFPTQTLANDGDSLTATYTFTTPATIGVSKSAAFRVGLFDTLGRSALDADVEASTDFPNPVFGDTGLISSTGPIGLPGYMLDHDIGKTDGTQDLSFRDHVTSLATGRLMATTGGGSFDSYSSGPDAAYTFAPNMSYTGSFTIERLTATTIKLTGTMGSDTYSLNDGAPDSFEFGMLAFHLPSTPTQTSLVAQALPANPTTAGIDFSNIKVEFFPASASVLLGDVDQNGSVNFLDIGPFIAILSSSGFQLEADIDESGAVNFLDIGPFIGILSSQ